MEQAKSNKKTSELAIKRMVLLSKVWWVARVLEWLCAQLNLTSFWWRNGHPCLWGHDRHGKGVHCMFLHGWASLIVCLLQTPSIIRDAVIGLSGSSWMNILSSYSDGAGTKLANTLQYGDDTFVSEGDPCWKVTFWLRLELNIPWLCDFALLILLCSAMLWCWNHTPLSLNIRLHAAARPWWCCRWSCVREHSHKLDGIPIFANNPPESDREVRWNADLEWAGSTQSPCCQYGLIVPDCQSGHTFRLLIEQIMKIQEVHHSSVQNVRWSSKCKMHLVKPIDFGCW